MACSRFGGPCHVKADGHEVQSGQRFTMEQHIMFPKLTKFAAFERDKEMDVPAATNKLKEGFLVKKDSLPKGKVNLRGCSIISPCTEYTKRDFIFRLIEHGGKEFLLQSNDKHECNEWTSSIAKVIRSLEMIQDADTVMKLEENHTQGIEILAKLETKITYEELLTAMQNTDAGIPLENCTIDQTVYKLCFTGKNIIDWLLHWAFAKSREQAVTVCGELLEKAHLHPVGPLSNSSFKRKNARRIFCDSVEALYRFSALRGSDGLDDIFEDDSSDSEDEMESSELLTGDCGSILKQGYLIKKGHIRHNWKPRMFILRQNPTGLFYYKPSKLKVPQGKIDLEGANIYSTTVDVREKDSQWLQSSCLKSASLKAYTHQFEIETKKGVAYTLKANSTSEKANWIEILSNIANKNETV
eukprot:gene6820-7589_t